MDGLGAIPAVIIGGAVGWGMYKFIAPKGVAGNASELGRVWLGWMALIVGVSLFSRFLIHANIDAFFMWLVGFAVWGGIAYALGWAYGQFSKFAPDMAIKLSKPEAQYSPRTPPVPLAPQTPQSAPARPAAAAITNPTIHTALSEAPMPSEDDWYVQALEELENGKPVKAVWARAFAEANGDDAQSRAAYIRLRVAQLKAAYEAEQTARADAERAAKVEAERLANAEGERKEKEKEKEEWNRLEKAVYGTAEPEARSGTSNKTKPQHPLRILGVIALTIVSIIIVMQSNILRRNFQGNVFTEFYRTATYEFRPRTIADSFWDTSSKEPYFWEPEKNKALQAGKAPEPVANTKVESGKKDSKGRTLCVGQNWSVWTDCVGEFAFRNGDKYVGEFRDGAMSGQGTLTFASGGKYVGHFRGGKYHGHGIQTLPNGNWVMGDWKNGVAEGQHPMYGPDGSNLGSINYVNGKIGGSR